MRRLRAGWRLLRAALHVVHGFLWVLAFPWLGRARRHERIIWWSRGLLRRLGIGLEVQGRFKPGVKLLVANHVSWLDIMAVHAVCPEARFVSKAEVRDWPLLGRMVSAAGTLYLERERRRDAMRVLHHVAEALREQDSVAVFPEGTVGDGRVLLPFHANLLQAAIAVDAPLQAVAIRYADRDHAVSPAAYFVGDVGLRQSIGMLALADGLVVRLQVLPARAAGHGDRRRLAAELRDEIDRALASPASAAPGAAGAGQNG